LEAPVSLKNDTGFFVLKGFSGLEIGFRNSKIIYVEFGVGRALEGR